VEHFGHIYTTSTRLTRTYLEERSIFKSWFNLMFFVSRRSENEVQDSRIVRNSFHEEEVTAPSHRRACAGPWLCNLPELHVFGGI